MNRHDRARKLAEVFTHLDYVISTFAGHHITTNETDEVSAVIKVAETHLGHLLPKPPRPTIPVGERYVGARRGVETSQHAAQLVKPHRLEFEVEILEVLLEWDDAGGTPQEVCIYLEPDNNWCASESYSGTMSTLREKGLTKVVGRRRSVKPTRTGKPGKATANIHKITEEGIVELQLRQAILAKGKKL